MIKHICAILWKQLKDTLKNKTILIQFVMFPTLTLIMENAVKMDGMPGHFFSTLFGVMYVGMAPLTAMADIISEEKEKNTLRVLRMANVKPAEYLIGVGIYIWIICMIGAFVIGIAKIAKITYSQQINTLLGQIGQVEMKAEQAGVIIVNMVLAVVLFVIAYKKTGLE